MNYFLAPQGYLRISWYADTEKLGPGKRFAVWTQGCKKRCEGCIAADLQSFDGGTLIKTEELAQKAICSNAEGISISGGEPFLQAEELAAFVGTVRKIRPDMGVIIYTGSIYEELLNDSAAKKLLSAADILVDGEYIKDLDDGRPMRGSSNQRVIFLSDRYEPEDLPHRRENDILFTENGFRVIGIPSEGTREFIRTFGIDKEEQG